eukprot:g2798.t1
MNNVNDDADADADGNKNSSSSSSSSSIFEMGDRARIVGPERSAVLGREGIVMGVTHVSSRERQDEAGEGVSRIVVVKLDGDGGGAQRRKQVVRVAAEHLELCEDDAHTAAWRHAKETLSHETLLQLIQAADRQAGLLLKEQNISDEDLILMHKLPLDKRDWHISDESRNLALAYLLNRTIDAGTVGSLVLPQGCISHIDMFLGRCKCVLHWSPTINMRQNHIGDTGATLFGTHPYLTQLDLSFNRISDRGAAALAECKNLKSLTLMCNRIGKIGAAALATSRSLRMLQLEKNHVGTAGAIALAKNRKLKSLNLSSNGVCAEGAAAFASSTNLQMLILYNNPISDEGPTALAENFALASLSLRKTKVTSAGIDVLGRGSSMLKYIDARNNGINLGSTSLPPHICVEV